MMSPQRLLIIFFLIITSSSFAQKLKKADRIIAENIQSHVKLLNDQKTKARAAGSDSEKLMDDYIIAEFRKSGCKPVGDSGTWIQQFDIPIGKEIIATSRMSINGKDLVLQSEYFPFAFSASKAVEASVVKELAENGVPWFVDLKELLDNDDGTTAADTSALIRARARRATSKGATALIVYNGSQMKDLSFNSMDTSTTESIPVIYINRSASQKHLSNESSSLEVKLNVAVKDRLRNGYNVVALADNHADSTVIIAAHLDNPEDVAASMELSRLLKGKEYRSRNYLFIVFSGERKGLDGINYFNNHPAVTLQKVSYRLNLDSMESKGLPAVKQSTTAINALGKHEAKARP